MIDADARLLPLMLHRDHLYIDAKAYEVYLPKVASVALLRADDDLLILPIAHADSGGFYIKQVNARGDRAIHAADFFRLNGIDESVAINLEAKPDASVAGFLVIGLFTQNAN